MLPKMTYATQYDTHKTKIVYIRLTPQMEEDLQRMRRLYPGNRSDLMRFVMQKFIDAHRPELDELAAQEQRTT
jgi:Arc/MetJ-type ribon-helix-helix transcriptional regulator